MDKSSEAAVVVVAGEVVIDAAGPLSFITPVVLLFSNG